MTPRRAAPLVETLSTYESTRRWIWHQVSFEEPPSAEEAVEQAEEWIMRAGEALHQELSDTARERVMTWLLGRWQRMDRED